MQFGKRTMFLIVNAPFAVGLLIHFTIWMLAGVRTTAAVVQPLPNTLGVRYSVDGKIYTATHLRSGTPYRAEKVAIRYLNYKPEASRIDSFQGLWAEPLSWWAVWLAASAALLLTNNTVFSKGTQFRLQRRFPFLQMDEFFPARGRSRSHSGTQSRTPNPLRQLKNRS